MSAAGPNLAGAGSGWATTPGNITAADGAYATDSWSRVFISGLAWSETPTPYLTASSFGFALGAGDTVAGISVEVVANRGAGGPDGTLNVFLARAGVQKGSAKSTALKSAVDTLYTFGSSSDAWGSGMVGADINALQVVIYCAPTLNPGSGTVNIDFVRVTVFYTDTTPDAFTFTALTNQLRSTLVTSAPVTITGLAGATSGSISGTGKVEINSSGVLLDPTKSFTINNGDTVKVWHTTSSSYSTAVNSTVTIGGVSAVFTSTTIATPTPTAFSFTPTNNAQPGSFCASNPITVAGMTDVAPYTVTNPGGWGASRNGAAYSGAGGICANGDTFVIGQVASSSYNGVVTVTLNINGVTGNYVITTRAGVSSPAQFTFTNVPAATPSTLYTSNTVTMSGLEVAGALSFTNSGGTSPQYSINGGAWTALGSTTINNGDTLAVRITSPAGVNQTGSITATVGGTVSTFSVTTGSNTPNAFSFTSALKAVPGAVILSNTVTISGISVVCPVNVDQNSFVSINGGAAAQSGNISNGQTLLVVVRAPLRKGASVTVNVTVGSVTQTFVVTSIIGIPDGDL